MAAVPPDKPGGPTDPGGSATASGPAPSTSSSASGPIPSGPIPSTSSASGPPPSATPTGDATGPWPSLPQPGLSTSNDAEKSKNSSRRSIGLHQMAFNNALDAQANQRVAPHPTYAEVAEATSTKHPYHLKVTFKKSQCNNTTLDEEQLATLVYNRLLVPEGKCLGIDLSRRDQITVIVDSSVPINTLAVQYSFEAKPGLFTKPIAPVIRQKRVLINQVEYNVIEEDIEDALRPFGKLTSEVMHQTFTIKTTETNTLVKKLDGVKKADRYVWMKVVSHIPSFILVGNKRAKVIYDGQPRQCGRCLQRLHLCPGGGKAEICERLYKEKDPKAVERADLRDFWDNAREEAIKATQDASYDSDCIRADFVDVEHVPEEMKKEEIVRFLQDASIAVLDNQLEAKGKGKWRVTGLMPDEVTCMMLLVHDRKVGPKNRIKCCPVMTSTPEHTAGSLHPSRENSSDGSSPVLPASSEDVASSPSSPMDASSSSSLPPLPSDSDSSNAQGPGEGTQLLTDMGANLAPMNLTNVFEGNGMVSTSIKPHSDPSSLSNINPQNNNDTQGSEVRVVKEVQAGVTVQSLSSENSEPSILSTEESASVEELSRTSGDVVSKRKTHNKDDKVLNVTEQEEREKLLQEVQKEEEESMDEDGEIEVAREADEDLVQSARKEEWSITKKERRRQRQAEARLNESPKDKREGSVKRKSEFTPDKNSEHVTQRATRMRTGGSDKTLGVKPPGGGKNGGKGAKKSEKSPPTKPKK